jgi:hypothetical protein
MAIGTEIITGSRHSRQNNSVAIGAGVGAALGVARVDNIQSRD